MQLVGEQDPARLPSEGWKVHISVEAHGLADLRAVLEAEASRLSLVLKVASRPGEVDDINAGRRGWSQVGKVATIYAASPAHAAEIAETLGERLSGMVGPCVDGDIQVHAVAPIFARWGAFRSEKADPARGGKVTSVDGEVVGDDRSRPLHAELGRSVPFSYWRHFDPTSCWVSQYLPLLLMRETALSRVYAGVDLQNRTACAIKVRRERSGRDSLGKDSVDRLEDEYESLQAYSSLLEGPEPFRFSRSEGWGCLAMELVRGGSLDSLPTNGEMQGAIEKLRTLIQVAHNHHLLIRDVRVENFIMQLTGRLRCIDFEFIGEAGDEHVGAVRTSQAKEFQHSRDSDWNSFREIALKHS